MARLRTPGCTTAVRVNGSMLIIFLSLANDSTNPCERGIAPPERPVPDPRGTTGTCTLAICPCADRMTPNSANSFFVITFAALVGLVWFWMSKRKIEPNTVVKFGLGFLFLAGGFYVFYYTKFFADANGVTSLDLFTFGWFIITFGELCLSPIGMSAMTKLSPQKTQAVMMGMWFLASAYGQYFAGLLGANIASASENATNFEKLTVYADGYKQLAIYALIAGLILIVISPLVKKLMQEVK